MIDPHCHTIYSDGNNSPKDMLKYSKKHGFDIIFTDHNDIRAAKQYGTIPAVELTSVAYNDFLLYFHSMSALEEYYDKEVKPNKINNNGFNFNRTRLTDKEIILAKEKYDFKLVLPHPFAKRPKNSHTFFRDNPNFLKKLDAVEVHNSLMEKHRNLSSKKWARQMNTIVGSDAHHLNVLGKSLVLVDSDSFVERIGKKNKMIASDLSRLDMLKSNFHVFKNNLTFKLENRFRLF